MSNTWFRLRRGFFLSFFPSDTPHYPYLLPNGWEWCNLEDIVCELKYGTSEKSLSVGKIAVNAIIGNIGTNVGINLWVTSKDMKYSYITNSLMKISQI